MTLAIVGKISLSAKFVEVTKDDSIADLNILTLETVVEAKVLLTIEEATNWLLDFGSSYHVTPFDHSFNCTLLRT